MLIKMPKKRILTLKEKMEVVSVSDREKLSVRALAERFNIGKSQAAKIVKNKEDIRSKWLSGINVNQKRSFLKTEGFNIDKMCFEWFVNVTNQNIPMSGQLVKVKAKEIAEQLGYSSFKASGGWLQKWQKRHNISFKCVSPKAADVKDEYNDINIQSLIKIEDNYEADNKSDLKDQMQTIVQDSHLINTYDEALTLVNSLKQFARNDFIAFQHIENLESHFQKCLMQQEVAR